MILGWLYGKAISENHCALLSIAERIRIAQQQPWGAAGDSSGIDGIPDKWLEPINDKIVTLCINKTEGGIWIPDTVTELTHRVAAQMPAFLGSAYCKNGAGW